MSRINEHNFGKPFVKRGKFGWLVVTKTLDEIHVWDWKPNWADAMAEAVDLSIEMVEWWFAGNSVGTFYTL